MLTRMEEEFNTNHPDKDERKKARRKRIAKRHEEAKRDMSASSGADPGSSRTGAQQVSDSMLHIDRKKHVGLQDVTEIRVKTDGLEADRRVKEDNIRKDRLVKLQQEAFGSAKANAAIEMRWAELLEKEIPQELHEEMQKQIAGCGEVIKSKDELIVEFQRQLRAKDEEYVRDLRAQADDYEALLQRIRREFKDLQGEYDAELQSIEDAYLDERERTIGTFVSEIDSLLDNRRNKELSFKEAKKVREESYQKEVEDLITKGASQYNKLKIELEMNIQTLKQQLEEIRATYQLNTEKLDYNYRVLTELDVEKNAELARLKRRLTKLKDQLSTLVTKYTETSAADTKTNSELTEDYRNLTRKYKDLQAKFRHFEVSDTNKYDEIWTMHEDEAKDFVDQLLKADKIITEYQMGWKWKAPDMHALQHVLGKHGNIAQEHVEELKVEDDQTQADKKPKETVSAARVRGMLKLLCREAGFLLNPEVTKTFEAIPDEEQDITKAENVLKTLGVKSEEKLARLSKYFFSENKTAQMLAKGKVEEVEENEEELNIQYPKDDVSELRDMISPEDVIEAVQSFMEDTAAEAPMSAPTSAGANDDKVGQKRLKSMRNFWMQLSNVVNDDSVDVWKQMEKNYTNLKELLIRRSNAISTVDNLNDRNTELKKLLNTYLGDAGINRHMQVPPAQVMRVRNVVVKGSKTGGGAAAAGAHDKLMSKTQ